MIVDTSFAGRIDAVLPQTQCRQCGYDGCRPYAEAIAALDAGIDRCPPGGDAGIAKLSAVTGRPVVPLDPSRGVPKPLALAVIDEALCIGCTLCIAACPVDAIVGAAKRMHDVVADLCTGCELCVPRCPVDCIAMVPASYAWDEARADAARERHRRRDARVTRDAVARSARRDAASAGRTNRPDTRRDAIVAAAIARARARRASAAAR